MAETKENTEQQSNIRVHIGSKVEPNLHEIVERLAKEENRTNSNMVECLLKSHPRIEPLLAETVGA